jgi:uncharacterized protein
LSHFFLDSSALVKRYVSENGTSRVRDILRKSAQNRIFVAQITPVEMTSALARRVREKSLDAKTMQALQRGIAHHMTHNYIEVRLTDGITEEAIKLLAAHPLRAYDAVQLASALNVQEHLMIAKQPSLLFMCADQRLLEIAVEVGLRVEEPK